MTNPYSLQVAGINPHKPGRFWAPNDNENAADVAEKHWREMQELRDAIRRAKASMNGNGEVALRRRAEAIRQVVQRIECTFEATGKRGGGWGNKNAQLVRVAVYPFSGESAVFSADSKGTLKYDNAHSCMYRTCCGTMR